MRRVDEFFPSAVSFLADAGGESLLEIEKPLLVVLDVHDLFPTTLPVPQRFTWNGSRDAESSQGPNVNTYARNPRSLEDSVSTCRRGDAPETRRTIPDRSDRKSTRLNSSHLG